MATNERGSPSHEPAHATHSAVPSIEEPASSTDLPKTASSTSSGSLALPDLTRSGSTPSSDKISMQSHTSIPVVGTYPLGTLQVHKIVDSPRPQRPTGPRSDEVLDMPPLESDEAVVGAPEPVVPAPSVCQGDVFLILDLPPNATVGCDTGAIGTSASGFQGIRDIPPGPHFIWVAEAGAMSRCGYWFVAEQAKSTVRIKQWDKFNEVLIDPASEFEARDHKANVDALYPQLVPHEYFTSGGVDSRAQSTATKQCDQAAPSTTSAKGDNNSDEEDEDTAPQLWRRLTSCISEALLARVTGRPISAAEFLVDTADSTAGDSGGFLPLPPTRATKLHQAVAGEGELHFILPEGDVDVHGLETVSQPGQQNPDTTDDILRLIDTPGTGIAAEDLAGEMQLAFLAGLHLGNLACLEHWWHLVLRVVLRAHQLALQRPSLCRALLETLRAQMTYDDKYISSSSKSSSSPASARQRADGGAAAETELAADREYGGQTSVLDLVPGNRRRLRAALTLYKRRLGELLLDLPRGGETAGQEEVGQAFVALEAWFWRFGWDLRTDYVADNDGAKRTGQNEADRKVRGLSELERRDGEDDSEDEGLQARGEDVNWDYDDEDDEYRPVVVDLDANGREVGLVSFS